MSDIVIFISKPVHHVDLRSRERYLQKGNLTVDFLNEHVSSANDNDVSSNVVESKLPQPALGLFDAETLARVQKSFPY